MEEEKKIKNLLDFIFGDGNETVEEANEFLRDIGKDPDKIAEEGIKKVNELIEKAKQKGE